MNRRPKIFAIYSHLSHLNPIGGDRINELATLRWMSRVGDVYYNGVLFDPEHDEAGDVARPVQLPEGDWDLVYIRSNKDILEQAHERGLKSLYLSMYDGDVDAALRRDAPLYAMATHIAVMTQAMDALYRTSTARHGLGIQTILLEQPGRDDFTPRKDDPLTQKFRRQWGDGFILGFMGRIDQASMPKSFLGIRHLVRHYVPDARFVFAGKVARNYALPDDLVTVDQYIPGDQMPNALSACDMTLGVEQPHADWAGSNRALDCVRCDMPLITRPYAARIEQLGPDYPFYFTTAQEVLDLIIRWRSDATFRDEFYALNAGLKPRLAGDQISQRNAERLARALDWPLPDQ